MPVCTCTRPLLPRLQADTFTSRYGYGYNGMDLTVGRTGTGHFVDNERNQGYSPSHSAETTPSVDPVRYAQSSNSTGTSSLSPPPEPLPCSSVATSSPVTETQSQHRAVKNSLTTPCSNSNGGTLLLSRDCVSKALPLEEEKPAGSAPTTPQNVTDSAQPQIYPWMRKLHINHGCKCYLTGADRHYCSVCLSMDRTLSRMRTASLEIQPSKFRPLHGLRDTLNCLR
ncbi:Homeobox protein Hox-A5 [Liparis tanakae]|uniref:Homeobox protein Hox-A5 n=1 Tax=Liparis tanakae TaxID=230148 RepID=A0A4Z2JES4_9TELE|nr:Homeobox protein Hox-A5 [Liparis tanakae]